MAATDETFRDDKFGQVENFLAANPAIAQMPSVQGMLYMGFLDLRVDAGVVLATVVDPDNMGDRGTSWSETTAATSPMGGIMNATKRLASIRNCMEGWGFPTSFVESEVSSVTWKFEVGGPFYERHVIVIALGSTVEPINHSIVILRFAR